LVLDPADIITIAQVNAPALDPTGEEGLVRLAMEWLLRRRQTKGAETNKQLLMATGSQSFTLPVSDSQNSTRGALATLEFYGILSCKQNDFAGAV
jgi:hypothetical protein